MDRHNEATLRWVLAHRGVAGDEFADSLVKETAIDPLHSIRDEIWWQASLPHTRRAAERRTREATQWIASHVRPKRRYHPPGDSELCRKALCRVRRP